MKELKINCPPGFTIDEDKSDLSEGIVHLKEVKKVLTYEDVAEELFFKAKSYYFNRNGHIQLTCNIAREKTEDLNNTKTEEQAKSILALNKLCNVAKYLNGDWLPSSNDSLGYHIQLDDNSISLGFHNWINPGSLFFKTKELAQQAIEILGEEEIKKALTLNH